MNCWRTKLSARLVWVGFSCSLVGSAVAIDYIALDQRLGSEQSPEAAVNVLREARNDPEIDGALVQAIDELSKRTRGPETELNRVRAMVSARAQGQRLATGKIQDNLTGAASKLKQKGGYREPGEAKDSNWMTRSFEGLRRLLSRFQAPRREPKAVPTIDGSIFYVIAWALLAVGVGALLFLIARHVSFRRRRLAKVKAILDESEPLRTADEWLEHADHLAAEGRYREAVRCLYLACLVRLDEAGIARFIRTQTNWEHYQRVAASPILPEGLDFRPPTLRFDQVWYGYDIRGTQDVETFRAWYSSLMAQIGNMRRAS